MADSKLCARENMDHIDRRGGRFVTVLPRARLEDREFREWVQTHEPQWSKVWDRPNPRRRGGPRDRWYVFVAPLSSAEAWPLFGMSNTLAKWNTWLKWFHGSRLAPLKRRGGSVHRWSNKLVYSSKL